MMKRIVSVLMCLLLAAVMAATAEETSWQEKLSQVEGVISVEAIPLDASAQFFEEKYLVTFEQPLDWKNPEAGTFPQWAMIILNNPELTHTNLLKSTFILCYYASGISFRMHFCWFPWNQKLFNRILICYEVGMEAAR